MLLGKRPRPPMKRTTSMSEITSDLNTTTSDVPQVDPYTPLNRPRTAEPIGGGGFGGGGVSYGADRSWKQQNGFNGLDQKVWATASPRNYRRHSADFVETADFLRSCSLCKSSLVPSRDIYMYRYSIFSIAKLLCFSVLTLHCI